MPCYDAPRPDISEEKPDLFREFLYKSQKKLELLNYLLDEIGDKTPRYEHIGYGGALCRDLSTDECARILCRFLQEHDVENYSLAMQLWWTEHKYYDRQRNFGNASD